jgi:PhoH-like ATPase
MSHLFKIKAKDKQQEQAINCLLNPEKQLVILEGVAGSGKTLLAVAAGLAQVLDYKLYSQVIFTRDLTPLGKDIGFLPGTEQEKVMPWCGGLEDALEIVADYSKYSVQYFMERVSIKAIQFMRGRSLLNKFIIIDEVQNISYHQMKVLLTRVGEGTKIVLLGDAAQRDIIHNNEDIDAFSILIQKAKKSKKKFISVVSLSKSERSELCSWAVKNL